MNRYNRYRNDVDYDRDIGELSLSKLKSIIKSLPNRKKLTQAEDGKIYTTIFTPVECVTNDGQVVVVSVSVSFRYSHKAKDFILREIVTKNYSASLSTIEDHEHQKRNAASGQ